MVGEWGAVPGQHGAAAANAAGFDPKLLAHVLANLAHAQATATSWATKSLTASQNNAVLASGANPFRIAVAIQLPSGLAAYIGPTQEVVVGSAPGPGYPGYLLPTGGGFLFGPENTLDVWVVHGNVGSEDIRVLEMFQSRY